MNGTYKLSASELTASSAGTNPSFLNKISTPIWNRLEARPRGEDMIRSLRSEVRDAAWMLCRQWQMGEFAADDAGTPVYSNLQYDCAPFDQDEQLPLEPKIESQEIFPDVYPDLRNLNIRLQMGNYFLRLLANASDLKNFRGNFLQKNELKFPEPKADTTTEVLQFLDFYKGRSVDGYKLYHFYKDNARFNEFGNKASRVVEIYNKFSNWYHKTYLQPGQGGTNTWDASRLEYRFETNATTRTDDPAQQQTKTVIAEEYYHGRLDWYNFTIKATATASAGEAMQRVQQREYSTANADGRKLIPGPVRYAGMPESRYWTFEDGATNLASVNVDRSNIGKLALLEFGLIYSNDWSLVPVDVPVGSFVDVRNLTVIDSFGKETVIPPVTDNNTGDIEWKFFTLSHAGGQTDNSLLVPQTITKAQAGKTIEEVKFMRDEMANMVWAIESIVPAPLGNGVPAREVSRNDQPKETGEKLYYLERTNIPVNWIPFVPLKNNEQRLVLRRGKLLNDAGATIRPNTSLLRMGLDKDDVLRKDANGKSIVYDVEDNEVPREGVKVTKNFQRTRWTNGEVYVWLGMQKETGKREGRSNLQFDVLVGR